MITIGKNRIGSGRLLRGFWVVLALWLLQGGLSAQVSGVVVNSSGDPIMGVLVQVPSTGAATTTDMTGSFLLEVPAGTQLEIASFGYRTQVVAGEQDMRIVLYTKREREKKLTAQEEQKERVEHNWDMFVLANGMSAWPFSPAVGVTIGMVDKAGWYMSAMTGFGIHYRPDAVAKDGYMPMVINGKSYLEERPFYTGKKSDQFASLSIGGMVRTGDVPFYWYGGAGYAYKSVTYATTNGSWVAFTTERFNDRSPLHSICVETGFMGNIKGFALSVGYVGLVGVNHPWWGTSMTHELKIGLGGMFNISKKN